MDLHAQMYSTKHVFPPELQALIIVRLVTPKTFLPLLYRGISCYFSHYWDS